MPIDSMMNKPDYRLLFPKTDETCQSYCKRLEDDGDEEMFIRKALLAHRRMELSPFGAFFEDYPKARMRHVEMLHKIRPTRTDYSFALKLAKNLGISQDQASVWIDRFHNQRKASKDCDK